MITTKRNKLFKFVNILYHIAICLSHICTFRTLGLPIAPASTPVKRELDDNNDMLPNSKIWENAYICLNDSTNVSNLNCNYTFIKFNYWKTSEKYYLCLHYN